MGTTPPQPPLVEVVQLGAMVAATRIEPKIAECRMLNFQVKTATRRFLTSPIDIQHSAFFGSIAWSFSDRPSCTTCKGGLGGLVHSTPTPREHPFCVPT